MLTIIRKNDLMSSALIGLIQARESISIIENIQTENCNKYRISYKYNYVQGVYTINFSKKYLFKYTITTNFSEIDFFHQYELKTVHDLICKLKSCFTGKCFHDITNITDLY